MSSSHGATNRPRRSNVLAVLALVALPALVHAADAPHPLSPISADEMLANRAALERGGKLRDGVRFVTVEAREPADKRRIREHRAGNALERLVDSVLYSPAANATYEATVSLPRGEIVRWQERAGVQPLWQAEDDEAAGRIIRADARWAEVLRARPDIDPGRVSFSSLGNGPFVDGWDGPTHANRRFLAIAFQDGMDVPGLAIHVDVTAGRVLRFDYAPYEVVRQLVRPIEGGGMAEVDAALAAHARGVLPRAAARKPAFEVRDGEVTWDKWRFRFGVTPREGLVLHQVEFRDGDRYRSVLYRGSLSELVVPYGSTDRNWYWRNVFDAGLVGMGIYGARSRLPGVDDPPEASYFPAVMNDSAGRPVVVPRAVSIRERDRGALWRHGVEEIDEPGAVAGQRARQLVLSYYATIGNYDYGWNWVFHLDGTLELDLELTGNLNVRRSYRPTEAPGFPDPQYREHYFGAIVAPHLEAVNHQHFFSFRLDLDVDGADRNAVAEMNVLPVPLGPQNPYGNAFHARMDELAREHDAMRSYDAAQSRHWLVYNGDVRNSLGYRPAYALMPGPNTLPLAPPGSPLRERASFLDHHFWATPYDPVERYAAGDYLLQGPARAGLGTWTRANRSLESTDVVVWHTFGTSHVARPEEWPVMSVHRLGFKLVPWGFFTRNPALAP